MPNVYYVKMREEEQIKDHVFIDDKNPERIPDDLARDDLFFIRFEKETSPISLKRLWKFKKYEDFTKNGKPGKKVIFEPFWIDNGDEVFFKPIELISKFIALNFFKYDITITNRITRQQNGGRSFYKLPIIDDAGFADALKTVDDFNNYTSNENNYRKVEIVSDESKFETDTKNLQIYKDSSDKYHLNPASFIDKDSILDKFDGNLPNTYEPSPKRDNKRNMYDYLQNDGKGDCDLLGFYELFCSQKAKKTSAKRISSSDSVSATLKSSVKSATVVATHSSHVGENLIIYGTPGCGKSHYLDEILKNRIKEEEYISRVTFHQDYTYTDFVGQILPKLYDATKVTYDFIPGPFTLALKNAIAHPDKEVALVIEEINRGNAASIFGDLFQLLDRDEDGNSIYKLTNLQITDYLKKEVPYSLNYIKLPNNLSIYATMNTGDQNVFTLDTAFKRRWKFKKLSNIFDDKDVHKDKFIPGMSDVTWKQFVEAINKHMVNDGTFDSEDKQLGKYFITATQLLEAGEENSAKIENFAYKVLEYLWNDVAKFDRDKWFNTEDYKTLDAIIAVWLKNDGNGKNIFNSDIKW